MAEWLTMFPPGSMVELDYGAVSSLFTWDELDDDHSGGEIQEALEAITQADAQGWFRHCGYSLAQLD